MTMRLRCKPDLRRIVLVLAFLTITAGCAGVERQSEPAAVPLMRPGSPASYLPAEALPNSVALLPPPPAAGSPLQTADEEIARKTRALQGTPRWALATVDDDLKFPHAAGAFSCALNAPITEEATPHLSTLLRRSLVDAGLSTFAAKDQYGRVRPFVVNMEPICAPEAERAMLLKSPSYPSGHAAIGWAWALILTEVAPERTDVVLARGLAYGQSRVICNVHWQSDVDAGRLMGAATVARLHADPAFRADLEAAKAEVAAARAKGLKPTGDCTAEAGALAE
jgi:acid phosphatase (class A)